MQEVTETDGVRVIRHQVANGEASQFFVSTTPGVSPRRLPASARVRHGAAAGGLAGSRVCPVPGRGQDPAGNGKAYSTANVPLTIVSKADDFAIGGDPNYSGSESLLAKLADLKFYARALSPDEVKRLYRAMRGER